MSERAVRCRECGRRNLLPEGSFVEAHCGRCEWPLTPFTWAMALFRNRGFSRSLQALAAVVVLVALFGGDVADWWASEPFRLEAKVASGAKASGDQPLSLANDPGPGETRD